MGELIQAAFSPVNLVLTVLLILVVLYWLMVILGALDVDLFDIDLDADIDADADADVDIADGGFLRGLLLFFYIGEIPIMILVSILVLSMWSISVIANYRLNPSGSMLIGLPILAGNFVASLFVCKVFFMPFRKFFKALSKDANASRPVIGRICTITTTEVSKKMGQAEMSSKGAPILINVVAEGDHVFHKGDEAVVTGKNSENGVYTIAPVDWE